MKPNEMNNRLFEIMEKINPGFKISENTNIPADVRQKLDSLDASALQKIDSRHEFKDAFKGWFNLLGFDINTNPIRKNDVINDVGRALDELGYN